MKQVVSTNVEIAVNIIVVDNTEWEYCKKEFPDAVYDEERKKYLYLGEDFFDMSDLGELVDDISNGKVFHLENVHLAHDYDLYFNKNTGKYIGVNIPKKDQ